MAAVTALAAVGPAAGQTVIRVDDTHADLAMEFTGGAWRTQIRPDSGGPYTIVPNPPATADRVHLVANPNTMTTTGAALPMLGIGAGGGTYWHLEASQVPGELYLGVSAQQMGTPPGGGSWANWQPPHVRPNGQPLASGRWVELQVKDVRGPTGGQFAVWLDTANGPDVYASTAQYGTQDPRNALYTLVGGHTHYNWAFTQPGVYEVDLDARAFYGAGAELLSNPTNDPLGRYTIRFEVQPVPEPALVGLTGAGALLVGRRLRRTRPAAGAGRP
jgi:surface-anchored protein